MRISDTTYLVNHGVTFNAKSMATANAMAIELLNYGVSISNDMLRAISYTDANAAFNICSEILKDHTVGKLNRPLFKGWESRTEFTITERVIQILGYIVNLSGNDLEDPSYMESLLEKVNFTKEKVIYLASNNEAKELYSNLYKSRNPLDKKQLKTLTGLADIFADSCDFGQRIYSDEVRIAVLNSLVKSGKDLYGALTLLQCKPSDALRYAAALHDFEGVKLPSDVIYANLTWKQRNSLLRFLNSFSYETLFEAVGINREAWTRFYKHVHLFSQKSFINKYQYIGFVSRVSMGFKEEVMPRKYYSILDKFLEEGVVESTESENLVYRTFASRVQSAIANKDFIKIKVLMNSNPGYLLRNLATVSNGIPDYAEIEFVGLVRSLLDKASVDVLFSILSINVNAKYRIIDVKGNTLIEEANYPKFIADIQGDIRRIIKSKIGRAHV